MILSDSVWQFERHLTIMKEDNVLEGIVQSVKFMLQQYLLACFYLSFFRNWLSIVLLMLNIQIINDFHNKLVELVDKKAWFM